jgi:hypothetical protein
LKKKDRDEAGFEWPKMNALTVLSKKKFEESLVFMFLTIPAFIVLQPTVPFSAQVK